MKQFNLDAKTNGEKKVLATRQVRQVNIQLEA